MNEPIQRWALGSNSKIFSVYGADGDWVRYEDHLAALDAAVAEIKGDQQ